MSATDTTTAQRERVGDAFVVARSAGGQDAELRCARCDHSYGPADQDPKLRAVMREGTIDELSPLNRHGLTEALVVRHFHCPSCALTIAVDVQERGDPIMLGNRLTGP